MNRRLRDEFLNVNEFITMQDAREKLKAWQHDYNHHRPHSSLGHLTPSEFVKKRSGQQQECPAGAGSPDIDQLENRQALSFFGLC